MLIDAKIIELPKIFDRRGSLCVVENMAQIPFAIKQVRWIYDIPSGELHGGYVNLKRNEFFIALSGSFDVLLDSGKEKKSFTLNRSYYGLLIPEKYWITIENFSTNTIALILSSDQANESNCLNNYDHFKLSVNA